MATTMSFSQHLSSSRMIGIAAGTASADGIDALDWNPALLAELNDWKIDATSYAQTLGQFTPLVQSVVIGRRLFGDDAAAVRITPGISIGFNIPATFTIQNAQQSVVNTYDKKITYSETFAAGYAHRFDESISAGISVRAITLDVNDTQYSL
ncbi:MAG TPA: hypothetical protein VKS81_07505, partial [Bacteroidota bacterium]|nr:hypothetical protein [Bacteroidota bacterium]